MLGAKDFDTLIPADFSAFHAHEILKTFEIRSFFQENGYSICPHFRRQRAVWGIQ